MKKSKAPSQVTQCHKNSKNSFTPYAVDIVKLEDGRENEQRCTGFNKRSHSNLLHVN